MPTYLKFKDHLTAGNYAVLTAGRDPATGTRGKILFFEVNAQIARVDRSDDLEILLKRYARKLEILDPSQVPDGVKAVLDGRVSMADAANARSKAKQDAENRIAKKRDEERKREHQNAHPSGRITGKPHSKDRKARNPKAPKEE